MYYEEKIIDDILMFRTSPNGEWSQCSVGRMSERIIELENFLQWALKNGATVEDFKSALKNN